MIVSAPGLHGIGAGIGSRYMHLDLDTRFAHGLR